MNLQVLAPQSYFVHYCTVKSQNKDAILPPLTGHDKLRRSVAGLSPWRPTSVHMGFVVDKVALEQLFLRVLPFFPANIIPPWHSIFIYHLGR
jgi:hypothetical protein